MTASYKISYSTPTGVKLIDSLPFSSFDLQRRVNETGVLSINVAYPSRYPVGYFVEEGLLEVYRSVNGLPYYLEGETAWLLNRIRYATEDSGLDVLELQAADATVLTKRRVVAYDSGNTYTTKLDIADDLIKDVFRENYGASAIDTARDISAHLAIAPDLSQGPIVGDEIAWKQVTDVLRTFTDAATNASVRVIYDVVRTGAAAFELRTYKSYRGMDHSQGSAKPVVVSRERRNLGSPELIFDYTEEYNYVYAGGKGEGDARPVEEASNSALIGAGPFARKEFFVNASNTADPAILQKIAAAALQAGRPRILFNGRILETPGTLYGIHYNYGDLVTASYKGFVIDCAIDAVHINVSRDQGEQLDVLLKGETNA